MTIAQFTRALPFVEGRGVLSQHGWQELERLRRAVEVGGPFADNAAAIAGGLTVGQFYRTASGVLMVVF